MPGQKTKTSRALIIIAVLLSLLTGATFRQSGAEAQFSMNETDTETVVSDAEPEDEPDDEPEPTAAPTASPTPTPKPTAVPTPEVKASKEASEGVWTSSGSNWIFLVNGTPYTGWLIDTDGKHYYFDKDGIMQTGWLDDDGKRYYLDADGIMQTGDVTVDGETYHLNADGSLKNYKSESRDDEKKKGSAGAVALTFDDGPGSFTDRLLDCLEKNQSKATFFMVGEEINSFPDTVKRMEEMGCELGNHSYTHTDFTTLSTDDMSAEIAGVDELLVNLVGHGATVVRPPYGSVNDSVRATVGTPMILWSIDTLDWETKDAQQTVDTVMENVTDGSIILMHDIFSTTVDAVEMLVPQLISEGYELVTVHELAEKKGIELQTGITYGSFE
ncbi:MAG: polysaccharide deacetylase family protein [Blautia sp.]|nr:polysaccharide deacetylase family protein [Blautia sp.]